MLRVASLLLVAAATAGVRPTAAITAQISRESPAARGGCALRFLPGGAALLSTYHVAGGALLQLAPDSAHGWRAAGYFDGHEPRLSWPSANVGLAVPCDGDGLYRTEDAGRRWTR